MNFSLFRHPVRGLSLGNAAAPAQPSQPAETPGLTLPAAQCPTAMPTAIGNVLAGKSQCAAVQVWDCIATMRTMPIGSVGGIVTDPPYSSGGMFRGDRAKGDTVGKYINGAKEWAQFAGDSRDQRSYRDWSTVWMTEGLRIVKGGGILACFTDWRQIATVIDAMQIAGWIYRGFITWNKGLGRVGTPPVRQIGEYVVVGTSGTFSGPSVEALISEATLRQGTTSKHGQEKLHPTEKPIPVVRRFVELVPKGAIVFDPFCGAGSTLAAARETGRRSIGLERVTEYVKHAQARCGGKRGE